MIGDRIKQLRAQKGYSITELAELAGVSKSYLSYIERNVHNNPSLQVLTKIAAQLDTSLEYLLGTETSPAIRMSEIMDEDWKTIIRKAVGDGKNEANLEELKELVFRKRGKEEGGKERESDSGYRKTSNIIIFHIDC